MPDFCTHGLVKRNKLGVDQLEGGVQVCRGCHLPVFETVDRSGYLADRIAADLLRSKATATVTGCVLIGGFGYSELALSGVYDLIFSKPRSSWFPDPQVSQ